MRMLTAHGTENAATKHKAYLANTSINLAQVHFAIVVLWCDSAQRRLSQHLVPFIVEFSMNECALAYRYSISASLGITDRLFCH